jgi:prepilin-type N-terminal cleavage/methylation domain-containing protein
MQRTAHPATNVRATAGFTLIELLTVMLVLAILLAIAVPAYSSLTGRARFRAAEHDIRAAMPAAEAFFADHGTYVGLGNGVKKSPPGILSYDAAVAATVGTGSLGKPTATTYCLNASQGTVTISAKGPGLSAWYTKKNCSGKASSSAP